MASDVRMECEGRCCEDGGPGHIGPVREVHVFNKQKDWGTFVYCDTAIDTDRKSEFTVEEILDGTEAK